VAVVAAEAAPVSGATSGNSGTTRLYAKLQRMAASAATDSDGSDTNFTARRAEFLIWEQAAQFQMQSFRLRVAFTTRDITKTQSQPCRQFFDQLMGLRSKPPSSR